MMSEPQTSPDAVRRPSRARAGAVAAIGLGVLALAGCAKDSPQDTWKPEGAEARKIDNLQKPVFAIAGVIGLLVFAAVLWCVFRYRDRGQAIPKQSHGNPKLEIALTILPFLILVGVAVPTAGAIIDLADTDGCDVTINVTGQQWWWEYDYPASPANAAYGITEPIVTSGELVLPAGECVLLRITSRDVIHSFWIPSLNGKKDAVPGRVHELTMTADEPGYFSGQCTEFCGLSHANMRMRAIALSETDFKTWVANQLADAPIPDAAAAPEAAAGYQVFQQQCARCHQVNGMVDAEGQPVIAAPDQNLVSGAAPNLTHLMSRSTFAGATWGLISDQCMDTLTEADVNTVGAEYLSGSADCLNRLELEEWLRNAPKMKPMYTDDPDEQGRVRGMPKIGLTEEQIDSLVAYLLTLK